MKRLIREELDVFEARRAVRRLADELGFHRTAREELVIVVSELGSNILKHGISGDITIERVDDEARGVGIQVIATDVGPPIANLELALTDGYSDRGPIDPMALLKRKGFGGGLGAVARLTDAFEYQPLEVGKRLIVTRYLPSEKFKPKRRW